MLVVGLVVALLIVLGGMLVLTAGKQSEEGRRR